MFALILSTLASTTFMCALAFGLLGDIRAAEGLMLTAFLCSIVAMVKR